jgi:hypothetical protein
MTKHKAHSGGDAVRQGQPSKASQREATAQRAIQEQPKNPQEQPGQAPHQRSIQGNAGAGHGDDEQGASGDPRSAKGHDTNRPRGGAQEASQEGSQGGGNGAGGASRHDRSEKSTAADRANADATSKR